MRKIFTVLLMVLMLSTPTRFASASDGGGIVVLNTIPAFARPLVLTVVLITNYAVIKTFFTPNLAIKSPAQRSQVTLIMTVAVTLAFFELVMKEYLRYFLYTILSTNPFYKNNAASNPTAPPEQAQEGLWSASNPEVMTNAVPIDTEKEKQDTINRAVQGALRDPEVAKNYLQYATPEVQAAVKKALENQAADRARF